MAAPRVWVAAPDEAPEVARLLARFRDWFERDWPSQEQILVSVAELIHREDTEYLLGALGDGPATAVIQLRWRFAIWRQSPDCTLEDLYVADAARGSGLGEALTRFAIERARLRGTVQIDLDTDEGNTAARRLYERCGFSAEAKSPGGGHCLFYRWQAPDPQPQPRTGP